MKLHFFKYQGTGNDFILVDNRDGHFNPEESLIKKLCHRKFGIGSDGLILIQHHPQLDFDMIFFNPDATQSLCGNGSRCAVHFARHLGIIQQKTSFNSIHGTLKGEISGDVVQISMPEVSQVISSDRHWFINNGSPHHIEFVEDTAPIDVLAEGRKIRYNDRYKAEGTNVDYVQIVDPSILKVRTYERGVEQETLSCGTGVVASSLAASFLDVVSPVKVITEGGELEVGFERDGDIFTKIYLKGGVEQIFQGTFDHE